LLITLGQLAVVLVILLKGVAVRRGLIMTLSLSLSTALMFASAGSAQAPSLVRGFTRQVTLTVTPARDRTRPYIFTSRGRIVPPARYCSPGQRPTPGAGNCRPILCPAGITDGRYCVIPGRRSFCSGRVTVRYQQVTTTISSRTVAVRPDCTYSSRVRFRLRVFTRRGTFRVRAQFQGNPLLQARRSAARTVRAG
jgi:hypothetical protein